MTEGQSLLNDAIDVVIGNHTIKVKPPVLRWYLEAAELVGTELTKEISVKKGIFGRESLTMSSAIEHFKKPSAKLLAHISKTTDKAPDWFLDNLTLMQTAAFTNAFLNVVDIEEVKKVFQTAVERVIPKEVKQ